MYAPKEGGPIKAQTGSSGQWYGQKPSSPPYKGFGEKGSK